MNEFDGTRPLGWDQVFDEQAELVELKNDAMTEAPSLIVTTTADVVDATDMQTSLREAIAFANDATAGDLADGDADNDGNANDTITFAAGVGEAFENGGTITLGGTQLTLSSDIFIDGDLNDDGTPDIEVNANFQSRIVLVSDGTAELTGLLLRGGLLDATPEGGAGLLVQSGAQLDFSDGVIDRSFTVGAGINGAGILNYGTLTLVRSTLSNNEARDGSGGAIYNSGTATLTASTLAENDGRAGGGGIHNGGTLTAFNTTLSGNGTYGDGGGIENTGNLSLYNSTVSGNGAYDYDSAGGGIANSGTATLANSIIIGNYTYSSGNNVSGSVTTYNSLIAGSAAQVFAEIDGYSAGNGGLLADNGGPVQTIALLDDVANPALDASVGGVILATDARGQTASDIPGAGADSGDGIRDLGAFEIGEIRSLIVTTTEDIVAGDGLTSLREAIAFANDPDAGATDTITFATGIGEAFENGGLIRLTQGELTITETLTIDGSGLVTISGDANDDDITIDGDITDVSASGAALLDDNSRLFSVSTSYFPVTFKGLTLTGGRTIGDNEAGGAILSYNAVTIQNSYIRGNSTSGDNSDGGAISGDFLTLTDSAVSGNSTSGDNSDGGAISGIFFTLTDSSVSGNSASGYRSAGGGIYALLNVTLVNSEVTNNTTSDRLGFGGGISSIGSVTLTNSSVSGNSTYGQNAKGGGIYAGDLTLTNSTISGNRTTGIQSSGAGFYAAGAIVSMNSTISGNSTSGAVSAGGGFYNAFGNVTLTNSTITGNSTTGTGSSGGGIYSAGASDQNIELVDSILAGNVATQGAGNDLYFFTAFNPTTTYTGTNIVGRDLFNGSADVGDVTATQIFEQTVDNNGVEAGLLADNGGPVQTIALRADPFNPALDASGGATIPTEDARGQASANVANVGVETGDGIRDIGAFEVQADTLSLIVTTSSDVVNDLDGLLSLREALMLANDLITTDADGDGNDADAITFDASLLGSTITLNQGDLLIDSDVTIDGDINGDDTQGITISGNGQSRIFRVESGTSEVGGLTISNGIADAFSGYGNSGGGILLYSNAALGLSNIILTGNAAADGDAGSGYYYGGNGGAIFASTNSTLTIDNSTISNNRAGNGYDNTIIGQGYNGGTGGGIFARGIVTITNSTIQNNSAGNGGEGYGGFGGYAGGNGGGAGGIRSTGTLVIDNSVIDGNSAGNGGAGGSEDVTQLLYTGGGNGGNGGGGGGLIATGSVIITNTSITGNSSGNGGNGGYGGPGGFGGNGGSGGGLLASGTVAIANTTLSGNTAGSGGRGGNSPGDLGAYYGFAYYGGDGGNGGAGGGALFTGGTASLSNVTAAGNSAGAGGNGGSGRDLSGAAGADGGGGGIANSNGTLTISNGTLTGNTAQTEGGGLAVTGGTVEIINSLVLANTGGETSGTLTETSSLTSGDAWLVFDAIDGTTGGGALSDNGGPVQTAALRADLSNPAIDAGTGALSADSLDLDGDLDTSEDLPVDARGFTRDVDVPGVGGTPDIGAFETQTTNTPGPDIFNGTTGSEIIFADGGGSDSVDAGDGNDAIFFGAEFDAGDTVDGGAGALDQIGLKGDYSSGLTFGPQSSQNIELIVLLPGSDTRFGASGTEMFSYSLTLIDDTVATGEQLSFQANTLQSGEDFTLDASAELDGSVFTFGGQGADDLTGSQQDDAFFFGTDRFGSGDMVDGQSGTLDSVGLQGDYAGGLVLTDDQLIDIEILAVLSSTDARFGGSAPGSSFSYNLTMADGNVAAGETLTISGNALTSEETLTFDGTAELDGMYQVFSGNGDDTIAGSQNADTISGCGGADSLTGNGGDDIFLYTNLTDSVEGAEDHILDFTAGDIIQLTGIDADSGVSGNQDFAFIGSAAFDGTAGELRAVNTSGNDWTIQADADGDAEADLTISVTTSDGDAITAADFLL
ncbi:MAG: choice-of-anchor Q domain-containing protein [Pseudomonadota bacterium]